MTLICENCHGKMTLSEDKATATCDYCGTTRLISKQPNLCDLFGPHFSSTSNSDQDENLYRYSVNLYENIRNFNIYKRVRVCRELVSCFAELSAKNYKKSEELLNKSKLALRLAEHEVKKHTIRYCKVIGAVTICMIFSFILHFFKEQKELSTTYQIAISYYEEGNYLEAAKLFSDLDYYQDSVMYGVDSLYLYGLELIENQSYADAYQIFSSIKDYKNTAELATECEYFAGLACFEEENYVEAMRFLVICTHESAPDLYLEALYFHTITLIEREELHLAKFNFSSVTTERLLDLRENMYQKGQYFVEQGEIYRAIPYFVYLSDYEDGFAKMRALWNETVSLGINNLVAVKTDGTSYFSGISSYYDAENWFELMGVASGREHLLGLRENGTLFVVADNNENHTNVGSWQNFVQIAAGNHHTVGLTGHGTVHTLISGNSNVGDTSDWDDVIFLAAGGNTTLGLQWSGHLLTTHEATKSEVESWNGVVQMATSGEFTIAFDKEDNLLGAGDNIYGQLDFQPISGIKKVVAGLNHSAVLKLDGTVVAFGDNQYGQCDVEHWSDVADIVAGVYHTVAIHHDGTLSIAGNPNINFDGESFVFDVSDWKNIRVKDDLLS